ncbi:MAG: DUF692 domain-containing protein [Planktomarina sp.]
MTAISPFTPNLPLGVGVGYKAEHFDPLLADPGSVTWLEIHAENYMGDGGRPLAQLRHLSEKFAISCHGVGLSIGGEDRLNTDHLDRLKHLVGWLKPSQFSEHLAWSSHGQNFYNDLLPVAYNKTTADRVVDHINQVQDHLNTRMLLENPSNYLAFAETDMTEVDFLSDVTRRTGCGLLLDVNNVFISATNQGYSAEEYIDAYPVEAIGEIHLGGHEDDADDQGATLLIDTHSRAVVDPVRDLYRYTLNRSGARPTLIEWDNDIPDWPTLRSEADAANTILTPHTTLAAE